MILSRVRRTSDYCESSRSDGVWRRLGKELQLLRHELREDRDTLAIKRALSRLSDRRLQLIGLCRHTLEEDVRRMIWDTEANQTIQAEVLQILGNADRDRGRSEAVTLPPPSQIGQREPGVRLDTIG